MRDPGYVMVNEDNGEYLDPRRLGARDDLLGIYGDFNWATIGLAVLVAEPSDRGFPLAEGSAWSDVPGRWAGARVALRVVDRAARRRRGGTDLTMRVMGCLLEDGALREAFLDIGEIPPELGGWDEVLKYQRTEIWRAARPGEPVPEALAF